MPPEVTSWKSERLIDHKSVTGKFAEAEKVVVMGVNVCVGGFQYKKTNTLGCISNRSLLLKSTKVHIIKKCSERSWYLPEVERNRN